MEVTLLQWIDSFLNNPIVLYGFYCITRLGDFAVIWFVFALALHFKKKQTTQVYLLLISLLITVVLVEIFLKEVFQRPRPFIAHEEITAYFISPSTYSFPSGHAASSFAAALMIYLGDKKWGKLALVLASLISFSRLVLQVHYPSDVLFGIILGGGISWIVYWGYKKYRR